MTISPNSHPPNLKPRVPSREECLALMEDQGMLPNIRSHSLQVARVAQVLAVHLPSSDPPLDLALLEAGALLHDIAKTECLKTKKKHTDIGAAFLEARGYPEVAEIVAQHVNLNDGAFPENHRITEMEIVHYADKRVLARGYRRPADPVSVSAGALWPHPGRSETHRRAPGKFIEPGKKDFPGPPLLSLGIEKPGRPPGWVARQAIRDASG